MSKTIVITRPREDAEKLAAELTERGFNCIIEPLLSVRPSYGNAKSLEIALENKPQAILATSKHAISAFSTLTGIRSVLLITVGRATAKHALHLGFHNVVFADGTAKALVHFVKGSCLPNNGRLLYIRGKDISTDIALKFTEDKFVVDSVIVYEAKKASRLSARLCKAITENTVNSVIFFSQNTAKAYAKLVKSSELADLHNTITALCLSQAIADKTRGLLNWKSVALLPSFAKKL